MTDAMLTIGATTIRPHVEACDGDLEAKVRVAMKHALTDDCTWFTASDDVKLRCALAAVLVTLDDDGHHEDRRILTDSIDALRNLSALLSGVPVDAEAMLARTEGRTILPIAKMWHETVEAA